MYPWRKRKAKTVSHMLHDKESEEGGGGGVLDNYKEAGYCSKMETAQTLNIAPVFT